MIGELADEVLRLRLARGWSQSELARRAATGQTNISRIESGLANPTLGTIRNVARALGVEVVIGFATQEADEEPAGEPVVAAPAEYGPAIRER